VGRLYHVHAVNDPREDYEALSVGSFQILAISALLSSGGTNASCSASKRAAVAGAASRRWCSHSLAYSRKMTGAGKKA